MSIFIGIGRKCRGELGLKPISEKQLAYSNCDKRFVATVMPNANLSPTRAVRSILTQSCNVGRLVTISFTVDCHCAKRPCFSGYFEPSASKQLRKHEALVNVYLQLSPICQMDPLIHVDPLLRLENGSSPPLARHQRAFGKAANFSRNISMLGTKCS